MRYFQVFILLFVTSVCFAQNPSTAKKAVVEILHSDKLKQSSAVGNNVKILIGNVRLKHVNTLMNCDSAYVYNDSSYVQAYSNIHVIQNDSIHLYGDLLQYEGRIGMARVRKNVRVVKKDILLTTQFLDFDRIKNVGYYYNKGKVVSGDNVLTSERGIYYPDQSEVYFKDSVVVVNPKYTIKSDTLSYNTVSEIARILGPTFIYSDKNTLYSENGFYNTKTDKATLKLNSYIQGEKQLLKGDTIFYNRKTGDGEVFSRMELSDTTKNVVVMGNYGHYNELTQNAMVTKRAQLLQIYQNDTLFLHADTLRVIPLPLDSSRLIKAYFNVKFFRKDLQGRCDSMVMDMRDSTNTFYRQPIIWAQGNQMSAEIIKMYSKNQQFNRVELTNSSFVVSPEDSVHYNQIKGRNMVGYIRNNELYRLDVDGNGQTIYYPHDKQYVVGVNRAESSNLTILLKGREITGIKMNIEPKGNINPPFILPEKDVRLVGFVWLDGIRPKRKEDIFLKLDLPVVEGFGKKYDEFEFGEPKK